MTDYCFMPSRSPFELLVGTLKEPLDSIVGGGSLIWGFPQSFHPAANDAIAAANKLEWSPYRFIGILRVTGNDNNEYWQYRTIDAVIGWVDLETHKYVSVESFIEQYMQE